MSERPCMKCKFAARKDDPQFLMCMNPAAMDATARGVHGREGAGWAGQYAQIQRRGFGTCGPSGIHFVPESGPAEAPPSHVPAAASPPPRRYTRWERFKFWLDERIGS